MKKPPPIPAAHRPRLPSRPAPPAVQPKAPPAYRPQPVPAVLQRKQNAAPPQARPAPAAPPVYRPQPTPKVLQRKTPPAGPAAHARPDAPATGSPARPARPARAGAIQPLMLSVVDDRPGPSVAGGVIQCHEIRFKNKYGRTQREKTVEELEEWEMEHILLNPHDEKIEFLGNKMTLLERIKTRLNGIQEARLRRSLTTGKGYESGTNRYVVAIHPQPPTPTREDFEKGFQKLPFQVTWPQSPYVYGSYPSEVTNSPGGTEVNRSGVYGNSSPGGTFTGIAFYSSTYPEVKPNYTPGTPDPLTKTPIPMSGATKSSGWQRIDKARLKKWSGKRKTYKPTTGMDPGESSGQDGAMGNVSAGEAAAHSGYTEGAWEWLHLIAFTLGGIDGNKVNNAANLVAGTMQANRQHKVVEDTIKKLLLDGLAQEVYVKADATLIVPSYHLARKLEYTIKFKVHLYDQEKTYTYSIDCLSPNPAQGGNMDMLTSILVSMGK